MILYTVLVTSRWQMIRINVSEHTITQLIYDANHEFFFRVKKSRLSFCVGHWQSIIWNPILKKVLKKTPIWIFLFSQIILLYFLLNRYLITQSYFIFFVYFFFRTFVIAENGFTFQRVCKIVSLTDLLPACLTYVLRSKQRKWSENSPKWNVKCMWQSKIKI